MKNFENNLKLLEKQKAIYVSRMDNVVKWQ